MNIDKRRSILALVPALALFAGSGVAWADGSNGASSTMPSATPGSQLQPWQNQAGTTARALGMGPSAVGLAGSGAGAAGLGGSLGGSMGSSMGGAMGSSLGGNAMLDQGMGEGLGGSSAWSNQAGRLEQKLATGSGSSIGSLGSSTGLGSVGSSTGGALPSQLRGPSSLNGGMQLPAYRYGGNVAGQTHPFPQGGAHMQQRYGLHIPNPQCTGIYPARGC